MPNKEIIDLKKELERLRPEPPGSSFVSVLNKLAYACLHSDPRRSEACALEACDLDEKQGFPIEQAKSFSTLGSIKHQDGNYAEAMSYCRKFMEISEELEDKSTMTSIHGTIANVYWAQGLIDKAREYFQKALDIRVDMVDKKGTASNLSNMGSLHEKLGDNESALDFFIRGLELYEEIGNKRGIVNMRQYWRDIHCTGTSL